MKRYVIVGHGVAGASAADRIRNADAEGLITVFTEELQPYYYRVRLPEVIAGQMDLAKITIHPSEYYAQRRIDLRLGQKVTEVDLTRRTVKTAAGIQEVFDALLLATGARSFIPPVPGVDKAGVFALRTFADAQTIAKSAAESKTAVLIGGGLLGLEAGYGLTRLGLKVQVVEFYDRLLPRQMDPAGAAKLQKMLENLGFTFFLQAKTKEVVGQARAEGIALEDGRIIAGELILFSAGIRPNLDLAKAMGLEVDKGLKVDDHLRTSAPEVWAAGDLIEHRGQMYGIWPAAKDQGVIAGTNMAGGQTVYEGTVMSNSLKVVGVDLMSAGNFDPEGRLESVIYEDDIIYRKLVLDRGRLVGFIFLGTTKGVKECQTVLAKGLPIGHLKEHLHDKEFDFKQM